MAYREGKALWHEIAREAPLPRSLHMWSLGQEGFVFRTASGPTMMIDPYLSDSIYEAAGEPWRRAFPPVADPRDCEGVRYVLITHHHEDHMDAATLVPLAERLADVQFVVPRAHLRLAASMGLPENRLIAADHRTPLALGGATVIPLAGKHERMDTDGDGNYLYLGYWFEADGVRWFHAGDTIGFRALIEQVKDLAPDIAMLPANGRDYARSDRGIQGNMNYREAADFCHDVGAYVLIPMHLGMFPHNDENPAFLADYVYRTYPGQALHALVPGEQYVYRKPAARP